MIRGINGWALIGPHGFRQTNLARIILLHPETTVDFGKQVVDPRILCDFGQKVRSNKEYKCPIVIAQKGRLPIRNHPAGISGRIACPRINLILRNQDAATLGTTRTGLLGLVRPHIAFDRSTQQPPTLVSASAV